MTINIASENNGKIDARSLYPKAFALQMNGMKYILKKLNNE